MEEKYPRIPDVSVITEEDFWVLPDIFLFTSLDGIVDNLQKFSFLLQGGRKVVGRKMGVNYVLPKVPIIESDTDELLPYTNSIVYIGKGYIPYKVIPWEFDTDLRCYLLV